MVNLVLFVFNLIPIPPLDGGRILGQILPPRWSASYNRLQTYGILLLVILLSTGAFGRVVSAVIMPLFHAISGLGFG